MINDNNIILQLGDIIEIFDETNDSLNKNIFLIDYISKTFIRLIGKEKLLEFDIENGILKGTNITEINILSRATSPSFSLQNNLITGKWINIYFFGDIPFVLVGLITNLENDMIEVKILDGDTLYINFNYSGIPLDLNISEIVIREKPQEETKEENEKLDIDLNVDLDVDLDVNLDVDLDVESDVDLDDSELINKENDIINENNNVNLLNKMIFNADKIKFGKEVEIIKQYIEVGKEDLIYDIKTQLNDLLNNLLNNIPKVEQTKKVINDIHNTILRYKQLREIYSEVDKYNNIVGIRKFYEENEILDNKEEITIMTNKENQVLKSKIKPLKTNLINLKKSLYWLILVADNNKKVYDVKNEDEIENDVDLKYLNSIEDINELKSILEIYKSNTINDDNEIENKYNELLKYYKTYFTPYEMINQENINHILYQNNVNDNFNAMIDINGVLDSHFVDEENIVQEKKYIFQNYNTNPISTLNQINMNNDTIEISSIITLPEPFVRFSKVNLPNTNILEKTNLSLNVIQYWKLFNDKTKIENIVIDNFNENKVNFNPDDYLKGIKKYSYVKTKSNKLSQFKIYSSFLDNIIPEIKTLFRLVKKNINGKLSIVSVLDYLEPFLIYSQDLGFMQYKEINYFIQEKMKIYISKYYKKSNVFNNLKNINFKNKGLKHKTLLNKIIKYDNETNKDVLFSYDISNNNDLNLSDSEILKKILITDYGNLFNTALSLENLILMVSGDIDNKLNKLKTLPLINENKCINYTISKKYVSMDTLKKDNNKSILYFDKEYDTTDYSILDKYKNKQNSLSREDFIQFLTNDFIRKYKYSYDESIEYVETLMLGFKKVKDGDYAIFYDGVDLTYYIRENNNWIIDNSIKEKNNNIEIFNSNYQELLCNYQKDCIYKAKNKNCETIENNKNNLENNVIENILEQFNENYIISKENLKQNLILKLKNEIRIFPKLKEIQKKINLKYNLQKYNIGIEDIENDIHQIISPYSKYLTLILGKPDIQEKYNDILLFCNDFTREPILNKIDIITKDFENTHWRYCKKTDIKLIPTFLFILATTYISDRNNYDFVLDKIIKENGAMSDDGDFWVDKYSGYKIIDRDFDEEEEYNDEGFKIKTREVIEKEFTKENMNNKELKNLIQSPENKKIFNIVETITNNMGINLNTQLEFIINNVKDLYEIIVPYSKEEYSLKEQEFAKKGKKIKSYKDTVNTTIMYLTLSLILIAIQVNIPSIKTKKTFPGCIKSFDGFPVYNDGDLSALNYIACVAFQSRSSNEPWNILLKQKEETISKSIKLFIDEYLLKNNNNEKIKRKIDEKIEYIQLNILNQIDEIPLEHDIRLWNNFLPPLFPFHLKTPQHLTSDFNESLLNELKNGHKNKTNFDKISIVKSKIFYFSIYIQQLIQNIIDKKKLLLSNSVNEAFMDNSCCNENKSPNVIQYFILENNEIYPNLNYIIKLTNIHKDIKLLSTPLLFYCPFNNKILYPPIQQGYSEEIIYSAFILFCNFNSVIPIPQYLLPLCNEKPKNFNKNETIENQIANLKNQGYEYNNQSLLELLKQVGKINKVGNGNEFEKEPFSFTNNLKLLLINNKEQNNKVCEEALNKEFIKILNEMVKKNTQNDLNDMEDFLIKQNKLLKQKIIHFIKKFIKKNKDMDKITDFLNHLNDWNFNNDNHNIHFKISNEVQFNSKKFIQEYIKNFIKIFPNIILNKVSYNNLVIPKYLNLSYSHEINLKKSVDEYYNSLYKFFNDNTITGILSYINENLNIIVSLIQNIPNISNTSTSIFNKDINYLFNEYLLFSVFDFYIELTNNNSFVINENTLFENNEGEDETKGFDILTSEYIDDFNQKIEETHLNKQIIEGNRFELQKNIGSLLISYINIMMTHKKLIDRNYTDIMNSIFKEKGIEKNKITDKLSLLTIEERKVNTTLKINKLGDWGKGLRKGLVIYDKDVYDEEIEEMREIMDIENKMRENLRIDEADIDQVAIENFIYEKEMNENENIEHNDLSRFSEDFFNNYDGEELDEDDLKSYD
jgi:hypothetical protein